MTGGKRPDWLRCSKAAIDAWVRFRTSPLESRESRDRRFAITSLWQSLYVLE